MVVTGLKFVTIEIRGKVPSQYANQTPITELKKFIKMVE